MRFREYVHAGRARLLIIVDETRALESIHNHHEILYTALSTALEAVDISAKHLRKDAYMKHVSLLDVNSSLNNAIPIASAKEDVDGCGRGVRFD